MTSKTRSMKFLPILLTDDISQEPGHDQRSVAVKTLTGQIALKLGTSIDLVHVEDLLLYPVYKGRYKPLIDRYFADQRKKLTLAAKSLPVSNRAQFLSGNPTQVLLKLCNQRSSYEMIAVGTHGRTGLGRVFLGSVAEEMIRNSRIPVFVVGPVAQEASPRFLETSDPVILIATTLTPNSKKAEEYGIRLARTLGARLVFFHSLSDVMVSSVLFPHHSKQVEQVFKDIQTEAEKNLSKRVLAAKQKGVSATLLMDRKSPAAADGIIKAVKKTGASFVVMGTHGRSLIGGAFFGRTVRDLILQAPVPVMTVRQASAGP